jgi:hypothetical protein
MAMTEKEQWVQADGYQFALSEADGCVKLRFPDGYQEIPFKDFEAELLLDLKTKVKQANA